MHKASCQQCDQMPFGADGGSSGAELLTPWPLYDRATGEPEDALVQRDHLS